MLTKAFQEQVEQLRAEAEKLAAHAIASAQATAADQVKDISKRFRTAYYMEAAGFLHGSSGICLPGCVFTIRNWVGVRMVWAEHQGKSISLGRLRTLEPGGATGLR